MKKLLLITASILLSIHFINATTSANTKISITNHSYGNSFIFIENGIEFAVFKDGQFDFNIINTRYRTQVHFNNSGTSFNTGYNYNSIVQYDDFGAVIQIENTPVFYDYYGRVSQIGNITVNYNHYGLITRLGRLNVFYDRYHRFSHYNGFINNYNRSYNYLARHNYYAKPTRNFCTVNTRPYRKNYHVNRYQYSTPYANNTRKRNYIANQNNRYNYNRVNKNSNARVKHSNANNSRGKTINTKVKRNISKDTRSNLKQKNTRGRVASSTLPVTKKKPTSTTNRGRRSL